jgi:glycosyltransferase involved in cell wall biosynthesis
MKILWMSNARWVPTGYGNQTNLFAPALKRAGYEIDIFAFCGLDGAPSRDADGILTYPGLNHPYGNDIIDAHALYLEPDLVITLIDPWVLDTIKYGALNWAAWVPVDCAPMLPANKDVLEHAKWIFAMSRFGEEQIRAAGLGDKCFYVPHGVDTELFKPEDRDEARRKIGTLLKIDLTGKYLVVMNSANKGGMPSRKGFSEAIRAFKIFSDAHPEALLYIHTDKEGISGEHLPTIIEAVGLDPMKVYFAPHYRYLMGLLPPQYLNDVYNAADVFLQPSHGEGFGIPIVEAQAAGCPVIVTDFSAMPELCFSGTSVPGTLFMHTPGAYQMLPDVDGLVTALNVQYSFEDSGFKPLSRLLARAGALEYDYRRVMTEYFLPALEQIGRELDMKSEREKQRAEMRADIRAMVEAGEINAAAI